MTSIVRLFSKGNPSKVPYEKNRNAFDMRALEISSVNWLLNMIFSLTSIRLDRVLCISKAFHHVWQREGKFFFTAGNVSLCFT